MESGIGQLTWTPERVRDALAEAFRVLSASERRPGHRRLKAAWPEHLVEWEDLLAQQAHKTDKKRSRARLVPTAAQIEHMEIVLLGARGRPAWLNGIVNSYPAGKRMLVAGSIARAHRYSSRQLCEAFGWSRSTFEWQRDRAASIVADELNRAGLDPW